LQSYPTRRTSDLNVRVNREMKKQGEPTEKPGIVGAFCRAFDIHEAISRFLPDEYDATDKDDRYTYAHGSGASGAVVYGEGRFLYSNHATDPVSQQTVNSFDLVRIHKFRDLDTEKDKAKPIHEKPSYIAMCEWAVTNPEVVEELDEMREFRAQERELKPVESEPPKEKRRMKRKEPKKPEPVEESEESDGEPEEPETDWDNAELDFAVLLGVKQPDEEEEPTEGVTVDNWKHRLDRNKKTGEIKQTISNLRLILTFDENLAGKIALNEFENFIYVMDSVPWKATKKPRRWTDSDDSGLRDYIENRYGVYHVGKCTDAMVLAAVRNSYHPVREFLDGLEWDGKPRLDTLFVDYLGAEDTPYVRAVTRKAFAAAVARIYKPGCKFDYVLTLCGP